MNKKTLQVKAGLLTGIITIVMQVSCKNVEPISSPMNDSTEINEIQEEKVASQRMQGKRSNIDCRYTIWYGEWLVEKKIGESYRFDVQDVSDIIGKTFTFNEERAVLWYRDEKREIDFPEYGIKIIPLDEQTTYIPFMPTLNEMGITGSYVTIFHVTGGGDIYFFLKDDDSMIMFYKDAYLELKRIKHIDEYEFWYHPL